MGIPLYGRSLTLCDPKKNFIGADACGRGEGGPYTREPGMLGYNEICESFNNLDQSWIELFESTRKFYYASYQSQWISYEGLLYVLVYEIIILQ